MRAEGFFDTTILIYAVAKNDPRGEVAEQLLAAGGAWSVQVLNEFTAVCRKKLAMEWDEIVAATTSVRALCGLPLPLTVETHGIAIKIAKRFGFHFYDALVISSALEAGSTVLYSEDMQHGQKIEGLTIRNPFASAKR